MQEPQAIFDPHAETQPLPSAEPEKTRWRVPRLIIGLIILLVTFIGVYSYLKLVSPEPTYQPVIRFRDVAESQRITLSDFSELKFSTNDGAKKSIADLSDAEFTVLVITRGWKQNLCLYCVAQTAQWAGKKSELADLNAELLLIFPIASVDDIDKLDLLRQRASQDGARIDFPTMLDIDLESVDQLGIRAQLSKPATYIVDREGKVRFAYVGSSIADRPSVESVLRQLELMKTGTGSSAP